MSQTVISRISAFLAMASWLAMTYFDLLILFSFDNAIPRDVSTAVPVIALNSYLFFLFLYFKIQVEKSDNINFIDLLWRVFVTGLVTVVISLIFTIVTLLIGDSTLAESVLFQEFIYSVNLGLLSALLLACFAVFRRLILYQKSKFLITAWRIFQYSLLLSLLYNILPFTFLYDLFYYYLVGLVLLGLFLSGNMKWVAYLNFKQKWKGILLVVLTLFYLIYFVWWIERHATNFMDGNLPFINYQENVFLIALIAFVFIYIIFSLLVLLFNLPTSSVFEQKLEEVGNFQKLSQSIQTEQTEERVYDILLESSVSTVFADAAWLELTSEGDSTYYTFRIDEAEVMDIKDELNTNRVKGITDVGQDRTRNLDRVLKKVKGTRFRSLIASPIVVKNQQIGTLALLKEVTDGFNREMQKIVSTFANQAGISIENFRLLKEALENERYKEELKIAKRVQSSLLPQKLSDSKSFEMLAFSKAADEVGGDYYDTHKMDEYRTAVIIGDVSGKGTSAAFHMSQMKGIFQSLSQTNLEPDEFMVKANTAISTGLDKTSFITATYFIIDEEKKNIRFSRAGHCPTLYYDSKKNESVFFSNKGMGLGMLRNDSFGKYVDVNEIKYKKGDTILLYTDGITEAQNEKNEEYGYERLKEVFHELSEAGKSTIIIRDRLKDDLYTFTGTDNIDDDYTFVIIKFS